MKRLIVLLTMVVLFVPITFGAQIVKDSEFIFPYWGDDWPPDWPDQVLYYGNWTFMQTWGFFFTGTTCVLSGYGTGCSSPSWGSACMWQDTGEVFMADTVYTMNIRWYDGTENGGAETDIECIAIQIASVDPPGDPCAAWTDVVEDFDSPVAVEVWQDFSIQFDTATDPCVVGKGVGVGFRLPTTTGAWVHIDSITLTYPSAEAVFPPEDPDPTDDRDEVGTINSSNKIDLTLEWDNSAISGVTGQSLYLMENDPNFKYATPYDTVPVGTTTYALTKAAGKDLNVGSIYYWRLDLQVGGDTVKSSVFGFETTSVKPLIYDDPNDVLVAEGDTVAMEVEAGGVYPITGYEWYTSDDPTNDTPGDDTLKGTGNPSSFTAALADGGKFVYCKVTNSAPSSEYSDVALLEVKRLMGYWKLEGNLESTPAGQTGTATKTSFVVDGGVDGLSDVAELFGPTDPNYIISIGGSEDGYNNFHLGLSASAWVKTSYTGWQIIAGKQDRDLGGDGWSFNISPTGQVQLAGSVSLAISSETEAVTVNDGEWHLITSTFDGSVSKIYIDGLLAATSDPLAAPIERANMNAQPLEFGGESATYEATAAGLLDEVKVYNYALHATEVLDEYNALAPVKLNKCVADYASNFDSNGDCKIDISDFADFAFNWLTDGCYGDPGTYPCN